MGACDTCFRAFRSDWTGCNGEVVSPPTATRCTQVACMACGTVQCHANGSARGTCRTCHRGMLPGWSGNQPGQACSYKGCKEPAVYRDMPRGKSRVCATHGAAMLQRKAS